MRVGVLALQGDYEAHARALGGAGIETVPVRHFAELGGLSGLVLPGGESSTMLRLMEGSALASGVSELARRGTPILATCAGVILLARETANPVQASLGVLDIIVERNGWGRQRASTVSPLTVDAPELLGVTALEGVFIRAPKIRETGEGVQVLARREGEPVLVRQGRILGATFHPELTLASPVTALFRSFVMEG